jgi:hypothetical protein
MSSALNFLEKDPKNTVIYKSENTKINRNNGGGSRLSEKIRL